MVLIAKLLPIQAYNYIISLKAHQGLYQDQGNTNINFKLALGHLANSKIKLALGYLADSKISVN